MVHEQLLSGDHVAERPPSSEPAVAARSDLDRRTFAGALGLILLAQLAAVAYLISRSYFFAEDFTFLAINKHTPLSLDLLRTSIFGHLVPGFIVVQKYFGAWFGANWTLGAFAIVAIQLAGTVGFARMLVALVGRRAWWTLWLTAAFGLSVVVLNTAPWWGATWTMQITLAAAVSSWGCALRYERTRDWRHLVSLAVMFTISVAFFEKAVITSAYLGLFVLLVGTRDQDRLADRFRRALRWWPVWVVMAVISAADLLVYAAGPYLSESGEPAGLGVTAEYLARTLPEGTFPALIGAVYPVSTIPGPDLLTVVVATVAALAVVVWTSMRSRLALRAWVWYFAVTLMSQGVVARGRLRLFDMDIVLHNLRYQGDTVYLFFIAMAVSVPAAVAGSPVLHRRALVAAVVAPVLALPLWVQSVHTISEQSPGRPSREFFSALRTGDLPAHAVFLDLPVSGWVIPQPMYPWNMASRVFPVVRPGTQVTDDPEGALRITDDGSVVPVVLADLTAPSTAPVCAQPGQGAQTVLTLPQSQHPTTVAPLLLALHYETHGKARIQLAVQDGEQAEEIRGTGALFRISGSHDLATVIAPTTWDTVTLTAAEGHEVCVDSVRLATLGG